MRAAIRKAIRETEEMRTKLAYLQKPDSEKDADDWSNAEEWKVVKQYELWWASLPQPAGSPPGLIVEPRRRLRLLE